MGKASRSKRDTHSDALPNWAVGHTAGGLGHMLDLLVSGYAGIGYDRARTQLNDAFLLVGRSEQPDVELRVNLINISKMLLELPLADWPDRIEAFVAAAAEGIAPTEGLGWDEAAERMRVRLYDSRALGDYQIGRAVTPELLLAPVIDYPTSVRVVLPEELAAWELSPDELIEHGLRNLAAYEALPPPTIVALQPFGRVAHYVSSSAYVASHLACLGEAMPDGVESALVAVPRRDTLILHPIVDASAITAVDTLGRVAAEICNRGPYRLSHLLHWWHNGVVEPITHLDHDQLQVRVPRQLLDVFETLLDVGSVTFSTRMPTGREH